MGKLNKQQINILIEKLSKIINICTLQYKLTQQRSLQNKVLNEESLINQNTKVKGLLEIKSRRRMKIMIVIMISQKSIYY